MLIFLAPHASSLSSQRGHHPSRRGHRALTADVCLLIPPFHIQQRSRAQIGQVCNASENKQFFRHRRMHILPHLASPTTVRLQPSLYSVLSPEGPTAGQPPSEEIRREIEIERGAKMW